MEYGTIINDAIRSPLGLTSEARYNYRVQITFNVV